MAKKTKPVKKAPVKKAAPKKAAPKKAVAKKAVAKKAPLKKVAAKKTAPASPVKKAAVKKSVAKKAAPAKKIIKKAQPVKSVAKPVQPVVKKKAAKPKSLPATDSLPPVTELSEELVEKAAHTGNKPMAPSNESNEAPVKTEDPIKSFDKNVFNKATSKGDPHSKLHLSSKPKNSIKPSGKKPLW